MTPATRVVNSALNNKFISAPLPFKSVKLKYAWQERVLFLNPAFIYQRLSINTYKRTQSHLAFANLFPNIQNGYCSCGCGALLTGRRRRWAHHDCTNFALAVWRIIDGQTETLEFYVAKYFGKKCAVCRSRRALKVDHVVPVKFGGGGCWLSNLQLLCHACHVNKTNVDFGWKQNNSEVTNHSDPKLTS